MSIRFTGQDREKLYRQALAQLELIAYRGGEVAALSKLALHDPSLEMEVSKKKIAYDLFYQDICRNLHRYETDKNISVIDYFLVCKAFSEDCSAVAYTLACLDVQSSMKSGGPFEIKSLREFFEGYRASRSH